MNPIIYPEERRVAQSALVETALHTLDQFKAINADLRQQLEDRAAAYNMTLNDNLARISQLEADLVGARFAAQSHCHTVEQLTKINNDLVATLRIIKTAAITDQGKDGMATLAIADMCDAGLRLAGRT